jgi:hypothetical protein
MRTRIICPSNKFALGRSYRDCKFPNLSHCSLLTEKTGYWILLCHFAFSDVRNSPTVEPYPILETITQPTIVHPFFSRFSSPTSAKSITQPVISCLVGSISLSDNSTAAHHIDPWESQVYGCSHYVSANLQNSSSPVGGQYVFGPQHFSPINGVRYP